MTPILDLQQLSESPQHHPSLSPFPVQGVIFEFLGADVHTRSSSILLGTVVDELYTVSHEHSIYIRVYAYAVTGSPSSLCVHLF